MKFRHSFLPVISYRCSRLLTAERTTRVKISGSRYSSPKGSACDTCGGKGWASSYHAGGGSSRFRSTLSGLKVHSEQQILKAWVVVKRGNLGSTLTQFS